MSEPNRERANYEARILHPLPGNVHPNPMGQIFVKVWAKGIEPDAQVFVGTCPNADQGPLGPSTSGDEDVYEGMITVPLSPFRLCATAEWTKATGETESDDDEWGDYTPVRGRVTRRAAG